MIFCEVCGKPATITGTVKAEPCLCHDEVLYEYHHFCQEHYDNWRNNEIEIPAERLEVLNVEE